eukprot:4445178-Amphidinium_carterae.1
MLQLHNTDWEKSITAASVSCTPCGSSPEYGGDESSQSLFAHLELRCHLLRCAVRCGRKARPTCCHELSGTLLTVKADLLLQYKKGLFAQAIDAISILIVLRHSTTL